MSTVETAGFSRLRKESILFGLLLLAGLLLLPALIYVVGKAIFESYGGGSMMDFMRQLFGRLGAGDASAFFLVLSPYLVWQSLRLSVAALRWSRPGRE